MKIKDLAKFILTVLLLGAAIALAAFDPVNDDTDIFLANPNIAAERPNVLIVLDNTANWNGPFTNEKAALVQVVNGLSDQYNVGIMIMSDSNIKRTGPTGSDGAYVRYHVRQMTLGNKTALASLVGNFDKSADKGDNNLVGLAMYEAYLYFAGKASVAGDDQSKADHNGTSDPLLSPLTGHALPGASGASFPTENASYRSPITDGCAKNFIIFISNGPANENATARAALETQLGILTGVSPPSVIAITPSGQQSNWADEMAKFMANADVFATAPGVPNSSSVQNVYTYTVEIDPEAGANIITVTTAAAHGLAVNSPVTIAGTLRFDGAYFVNTVVSTTSFTILNTITPNPATESTGTAAGVNIAEIKQTSSDMTALLKSMAANGKGKYFGVSSGASGTAIVDALNAIFTEVQAVNSVFASTTLPVSVNVRGTNLNQVYIGVFRPDPNKSPRWLGNLKMYNLGLDTTIVGQPRVFLADASKGLPPATGAEAENTTTGFISQNAVSFWTASSNFWNFRNASQNGPGGPSDRPDGDLVEKGGAAQQLRIAFAAAEASTPQRRLYTCTDGGLYTNQCPSALTPLATPLANTPFSTANTDIAGLLQLDARFVAPLTAYVTQPVATLTDRLPVQYFNNTNFGVSVASLDNAANTATITNLTTSVPKSVSALTGTVNGTINVNITNITKVSGNWTITTATAFAGVVDGTTVLPAINCTAGSGTFSNFNSLSATDRKVTAHTTSAPFTYTLAGGPTGSPSCSGGTVQGPGPVDSTTAQATVGGHGYVSGQSVTIQGASPVQFNGTYNVTVIDANHFNYTMTTAAGASSGTITASGNTTTATATTQAAHTFLAGTSVTVSGASNAAYNGAKTILSVTGTTFTYSVGATAIGPNTNTTGVTAFQGGGTTVTATIPNYWGYWCSATSQLYLDAWNTPPYVQPPPFADFCGHGFTTGQTIYVSGSDVAGYNGAFTVTVINSRTFTYTTATALPANSSYNVYASSTISDYIFGYAFNHNLKDGDRVAIDNPDGADAITGTYNIYSVYQSDYYFYIYAPGLPPITKTNYTIRPIGGTNALTGVSGTPPLAYATLWSHGYPNGQEVRIAGASPAAYNGINTIRVCDGTSETYLDRFGSTVTKLYCYSPFHDFSYPLASAPGVNTSLAVTSSIKSTTARATSVNHGFSTGSTVTISGATPADFNGSKVVTVWDANTFTYPIATLQGDATGTIVANQAGGAEGDLIIRWVRGEDNFGSGENVPTNTSTTDIRASVHGDVLHSRPAVINYNRFGASEDDVFVYYGGNDGVFHAVKGGYAVPSGDVSGLTPGMEAWGFVAQEFFGEFKRMRNNSPMISSSFKKPYFMDGPIGVLTEDKCCLADSSPGPNGKLGNTGDKVNLYIANRRGGRFLYALDVNNPVAPNFLWKITNSTTSFSELGQTWSQPTVVPALAGLSVPVLVFGAGYDQEVDDVIPSSINSIASNGDVCLDASCTVGNPASRKERSMGRGIYVVNAYTGALIWSAGKTGSGATKEVAGMNYAIPSDVTVIRNESTGVVNRAYVGDTGGNLWRIDFKPDPALASPNLALTTVTKLASIADESTAAGRRKFLFPPDVVGQIGFDAILIGSGDREHPFDTTVTNRFYMFKDKGDDTAPLTGTAAATCDPTIVEGPIADATDACAPAADASATPPVTGDIPGMSDLTSNCIQEASKCVAVGGETQSDAQARITAKLGSDRGWFITLNAGEKVVGNAISIGGTTFFNTNQPSATAGGGACGSNLGIARQYQVATADATSTADLNAVGGLTGEDRSLVHAGGGYLPSPVHVVVMLGGQPVEAVISGVQVSTPAGVALSSRLRKFWYKEVDPR